MRQFQTDKRLYLTADKSRVVEEDDPERAFLFKGVGATVTGAEAEEYGLSGPDADAESEPDAAMEPEPQEPQAAETEPDAKAMDAAPANKAVKGPAEKKAGA